MIDVQTHFVAVCPHCAAGLKIRRVYLGRQVKCKQCDEVFAAEDGQDGGDAAPGELQPSTAASPPTEPERIVVTCPSCRAALSVRRAYVGQPIRCRQCDDDFLAADPARAHPAGTSNDQNPGNNRREVRGEDLGRLRGELEWITGEYLGLRSAHDQLQAAHGGLQADHGALQAANAQLREAHTELLSAHDELAAEIGELRPWHDRLVIENQRLTGDRDRLQAGWDRIQADRDRLGVDLQLIVEALGGIAPGEVRRMAEDRSSLTVEVDRLRGEVDRLRGEVGAIEGERAAREREVAERDRRREADLLAVRTEADRLARLIADRDADLEAARAEAEHLRVEKERAADDAERMRATLAEIDRELHELREQDRDEIERLRAEIELLRAEFERPRPEPAPDPSPLPFPDREEELRAAHARIESLQGALADLHRLEREMRGILGGIGIRIREI